jgi:hypothetical protein
MTFLDMNTGQPWGRYVVSETVTVPKYEYLEVKERVWVPTWAQEPRPTTVTQYDPIVSYQLKPRSIPSANPFSPPQQIVEYAPIVQYQPRNVQVMQMTTYQKYEEREISRMVPQLVNASEQRTKFVDRPLTANPSAGPMASNLVQESAMVAQANRTSARYATRSIDYPASSSYGSPMYAIAPSNATWSAPRTLAPPPPMSQGVSGVAAMPASYVNPSQTFANATPSSPPESIVVGNGITYSSALVPVPSAWVASNPTPVPNAAFPNATAFAGPTQPMANAPYYGYPQGYPQATAMGYPTANPYAANPYAANPYAPNPYGAPNTASNPYAWLTSSGTLFSTNLFANRSTGTTAVPGASALPNASAYTSNAPVPSKPSAQAGAAAYPGTYLYPPTVNSTNTAAYPYRDPMQMGAPPTVMR